ncbi:MAG: ion transporter [Actinomycetota bacterium]
MEKSDPGDTAEKTVDLFLIILITLNVFAIVLQSVISLSVRYYNVFRIFEIISVSIFTAEYMLRLWACNINEDYKGAVLGRLKFGLSPLSVIDFFAILPFYLPLVIGVDLRFLRLLRLFRLFRVFKFSRYFEAMNIIMRVFKKKRGELILTLFTVFLLLIIVSGLMFQIESRAQPENFSSIPSAMWWGISAVTPVDFGLRPVTLWGKILSAIVAFLGVGLFALPAGIISSGLSEDLRSKKKKVKCPDCGKEIDAG